MKQALIIFVRNPELGKVKTRLAKSVGDEKALAIYIELLQHTHNMSVNLDCDKFVYYVDVVNENDIWGDDLFYKEIQIGNDLGDRMKQAFFRLFEKGYKKTVIIGSDCPSLTKEIIEDAFEKLTNSEIVIGPSKDGGYYLLGLSVFIPEIFKNKKWSTDTVLTDTLKDTVALRKQCSFLVELSDIDTEEDYNNYYLSS